MNRALVPVAATFVGFGTFWGGWAVATVDVEHSLGVSHGGFGALLSVALAGAAAANAVAGALAERWGTSVALSRFLVLWGVLLWLAAAAGPVAVLAVALAGIFAAGGSVDVVMNVAATAGLQGEPGKLVRFHAFFNGGAALGAATTGLLLRAGVSWRWPWLVIGAIACVLAWWVRRAELPVGQAGESAGLGASITTVVRGGLLLVAVALGISAMVEGGIETWGVLYLRDQLESGVLLGAGGAFLGYSVATAARTTLGPLAGGFGARRGLQVGGLIASGGLALLALSNHAVPAAAGLVIAAAGISVCWPLLVALAAEGRERPAAAIGGVTSIGYLGFVVGPALVGGLAGWLGLRGGLIALAAAALLVTGAGRRTSLGGS